MAYSLDQLVLPRTSRDPIPGITWR